MAVFAQRSRLWPLKLLFFNRLSPMRHQMRLNLSHETATTTTIINNEVPPK